MSWGSCAWLGDGRGPDPYKVQKKRSKTSYSANSRFFLSLLFFSPFTLVATVVSISSYFLPWLTILQKEVVREIVNESCAMTNHQPERKIITVRMSTKCNIFSSDSILCHCVCTINVRVLSVFVRCKATTVAKNKEKLQTAVI